MAGKHRKREMKVGSVAAKRESGLPGGGQGRIDEVGRTGVYPGSGPYPSSPAETRTPASFVHGQTDAEGRQIEGGSEILYFEGQTLLGGVTAPPSGPAASPEPEVHEKPAQRKPRAKRVHAKAKQKRSSAARGGG